MARASLAGRALAAVGMLTVFLPVDSLVAAPFGVASPPEEPGGVTVGTALSYGVIVERDADFWGTSLNFAHAIEEDWGFAWSIAFDRETEQMMTGARKTVDSFTAIITPYYVVTDWLTISAGFGKGFADNDNPVRSLRFTEGDWATGGALGFDLFTRDRFSVGLDTSLEYNLSEKEWSLSWDIGCSISF